VGFGITAAEAEGAPPRPREEGAVGAAEPLAWGGAAARIFT